ncbi:Rossmann-like and DUF2520 domain-containing protein [Pilimelia columellifera]|uniref:DUF2520 domain-containing protein n=1 Tax=Pilimelia columellifera subsp. columellifera TaxID=706583 RepID=A0ABP6AMU9_9ACTN
MSASPRPPGFVPAGTDPAAPLRLAVVGVGRVGAAVGAALVAAGHRVIAACGSGPTSMARVASVFPGVAFSDPVAVARQHPELLLLAVPDDALPSVAAAVADHVGPGQVVAHLSGASGTGVLAPVVARGAGALALHPVMTFTGGPADLTRLTAGISFGVTADGAAAPLAGRLVADLGGRIEWVAEADRPLYHAAIAHGVNHLVTLVNDAMDVLRTAGVADPAALLRPIASAALDNALASGDAALTGPVSRGDLGTVGGHTAALAAAAGQVTPAYRALAGRTARRAAAAGRLPWPVAEAVAEMVGADDTTPPARADVSTGGSGPR